jgi:hypothetical protein
MRASHRLRMRLSHVVRKRSSVDSVSVCHHKHLGILGGFAAITGYSEASECM